MVADKTSPIMTYGGRATTKPGVNPREHAVVYTSQEPPALLTGETGIVKDPIRVDTGRQDIWLDPRSRLNFGLQQPVQHNVKVKDLGRVAPEDMPNLMAYWRMEHPRR